MIVNSGFRPAAVTIILWVAALTACVNATPTPTKPMTIDADGPKPVVVPRVVTTMACPSDSETFVYRMRLKLSLRNDGSRTLVVPAVNQYASRITIADSPESLKAGRFDVQIDPEVLMSGEPASLRRDDFVIVGAGESRELSLTLELSIPSSVRGAVVPTFVPPGKHWLTFTWRPMGSSEATMAKWVRVFEGHGELLTKDLVSEPISFVVPDDPAFAECK